MCQKSLAKMWSKHRVMNAFIRQKYARCAFGRFAANAVASNDTDILALSILPNQPFNSWTQRFINIDSRRFCSDQTIEVLLTYPKTITKQNKIHTHIHTLLSCQFSSKKKNIFSLFIFMRNRMNKWSYLVWYAWAQSTSIKRSNRKYDFYDLYGQPEWVSVMNEL